MKINPKDFNVKFCESEGANVYGGNYFVIGSEWFEINHINGFMSQRACIRLTPSEAIQVATKMLGWALGFVRMEEE